MNKNTSAVDREKAESSLNRMSEYKIGHTTYLVKTTFNLAAKENLYDILKRLILRESEIIGQTGQEPEKQAV